jgi:hypothetical protein
MYINKLHKYQQVEKVMDIPENPSFVKNKTNLFYYIKNYSNLDELNPTTSIGHQE